MTPAQQSALEALAGRALTADQVAAIDPLLADPDNRNDVAIAAALSVGRVQLTTHMISARGVREVLSVADAVRLLNLFKSTAAAFDKDPATVPPWLDVVLTIADIPEDQHAAYFDTVACAHEWLQADGIDMGATRPRGVLDMIAMSDPSYAATVATLKALGERANPIHYAAVSDALNTAEGRETL